MKAGLRWGWECAAAAALVLAPAGALAQDAGQATPQNSVQPATGSVGPRELQNFNLPGTVTQPAPSAPQTVTRSAPAAAAGPPPERAARTATSTAQKAAPPSPPPAQATAGRAPDTSAANPSAPVIHGPLTVRTSVAPVADSGQGSGATGLPAAPVPASADGHVSLLPGLLAALLLAVGGLYLFWRSRSRMEFAGTSGFEFEPAPAPVPPPTPKPMPRAAVAPTPAPPTTTPQPPSPLAGIVSTRLRPWIELGFEPLSCVVDDEKIAIEFELELFNSGSAPARSVLVEARLVNAGREQDQHLSAFFANPVGEGQRIVSIGPLQRVGFKSAVVVEREQLQIYNVEGRKVFVPLLAFNVLYRWASGEGQSSLSYLVGRDTKGDKMAPFRADLGTRTFQGLGKQLLPVGLRQ